MMDTVQLFAWGCPPSNTARQPHRGAFSAVPSAVMAGFPPQEGDDT